MRNKVLVFLAVTALMVAGATAAFAKRGGPMDRRGGGMFSERMLAAMEIRLKLTPDQSGQVRQIVDTQKSRMREQFGPTGDERQALIKQIFTDNPNQDEIQKRIAALQQRHADMLANLVQTGQQINKVLTPEQRAEFQKMLDEHVQMREKMRDRMRNRQSKPQPQQ